MGKTVRLNTDRRAYNAMMADPLILGSNLSQKVRHKVERMLYEGLPEPIDPPIKDLFEGSVHLPSSIEERLLQEVDGNGSALGRYLSGILWANYVALQNKPVVINEPERSSVLSKYLRYAKMRPRSEQVRYMREILDGFRLENGMPRVIFGEAATGTGKTLAYLSAILEYVAGEDVGDVRRRGLVTVPTLALALQVDNDLRGFFDAGLEFSHVLVCGMNEFLNPELVIEYLHDLECGDLPLLEGSAPHPPFVEQVRAWISGGGIPSPSNRLEHPFMCADLVLIAGQCGFLLHGLHGLRLQGHHGEDAKKAYRSQFERARDADIVVCTHAMLANEVRMRMSSIATVAKSTLSERQLDNMKDLAFSQFRSYQSLVNEAMGGVDSDSLDNPRLGVFDCAVIDEAHTFEENFSRALSTEVSIRALLKDLKALEERGIRGAKGAVSVVRKSLAAMIDIGSRSEAIVTLRPGNMSADQTPEQRELERLIREMAELTLPKKTKNETPELTLARNSLEAFKLARSASSIIDFSPARHLPRLVVGEQWLTHRFDFLWSQMLPRTALVSATLSLTPGDYSYLMTKMAIHPEWARPVTSVAPPWLYSPVTLYLPVHGVTQTPDNPNRFRAPTAADKYDESSALIEGKAWDKWYGEVAEYVSKAWRAAAGGCLVLLSSYSKVDGIESRLRKSVPEEIIIAARRGVPTGAQIKRYAELVKSGKKPLMLGVGPSWTGIDIQGGNKALFDPPIAPEDDNVLTDVIIPAFPFGMNRSPTHMRRTMKNMLAEINETASLTKQGCGRLVRREGVPNNRRLHILDGRLLENRFRSITAVMLKIMSRYEASARRPVV